MQNPSGRFPGGAGSASLFIRLWALGLLGVLICGGCAREPGETRSDADTPRQAVVFMLDAARPDRFSCYGYDRDTTPEMDKLARAGMLCEAHFAQGTGTRASLPTTLYSRYFIMPMFPASPNLPLTNPRDLFRRPDDQSVSLTEALRHDGIRTAVISAHPYLKKGTRFADSFDELIDLANVARETQIYPPIDEVMDRTLLWLDAHRDEDFLLYVHIMDTHFPHFFGADARGYLGREPGSETSRFRPTGEPKPGSAPLKPLEREYLDALYDGSLRFTDRQIGRLIDWFESQGRLDSAVLAITADHGEHLMEVPKRFAHLGPWYDAVARIPLIISCPDRLPPTRINSMTESIDLMPTLLRLLDVDMPSRIKPDGVALQDLRAGRTSPREQAMMRGAIRTPDWKLILDSPDSLILGADVPDPAALQGELYDLKADPLETRNLWSSQPRTVSDLAKTYRDAMRERYLRYEEAIANEQPLVPFAVGANWFEPVEDLTIIWENPMTVCADDAQAGRWIQCDSPYKFWLMATPGAGRADFSMPIPDGHYRLVGQIFGEVAFGFDDGSSYAVKGQPLDEENFVNRRSLKIGEVSVSDGRLDFSIQPRRGGGCALVRLLGFLPVLDGDVDLEDEAERRRIQRLESLGYVN